MNMVAQVANNLQICFFLKKTISMLCLSSRFSEFWDKKKLWINTLNCGQFCKISVVKPPTVLCADPCIFYSFLLKGIYFVSFWFFGKERPKTKTTQTNTYIRIHGYIYMSVVDDVSELAFSRQSRFVKDICLQLNISQEPFSYSLNSFTARSIQPWNDWRENKNELFRTSNFFLRRN